MKLRGYVAVGLIALFCGLVLYAPATTFNSWLTPKDSLADIQYFGIEGTLLQGQVAAINIKGHTVLSNLRWSFRPLWLLLAQRGFNISGGGEQGTFDGTVTFTPTGGVNLHGLRASMKVKTFLGAMGQAFLPLDGQIGLDIQSLKLRQNVIKQAEAVMQVQGLAWTLAKEPLNLGDFKATATTDKDVVLVKIESASGPLEVTGDVKLSPDQNYQVQLQLRAKPQANEVLRNLIGSMGQPDAQGWVQYRSQGRLAP